MNYKIIQDKAEFEKFINWLPDLAENERYYLFLVARKKYCDSIPNNNLALNRFLCRKEDLFNKVLQLECPIGAYKTKDGLDVPQESLALYISVNPRCLNKGLKAAAKQLVDSALYSNQVISPEKIALNCVKDSCSRKNYIVFDIDDKNPKLIDKAFNIVGEHPYIETRGGYHLLVDNKNIKESADDKTWYKELMQFSDTAGDELSPVPGCAQGNFAPRLFLP
jgi:hypothetical protein